MDEQNIRMAIDRHWAASAAGDQVAEHEIFTPILCASTHSQARSSTVGVICKRFVAITLVDHRVLWSGGSPEKAISGLPSM
jgi:hypothetical protein